MVNLVRSNPAARAAWMAISLFLVGQLDGEAAAVLGPAAVARASAQSCARVSIRHDDSLLFLQLAARTAAPASSSSMTTAR